MPKRILTDAEAKAYTGDEDHQPHLELTDKGRDRVRAWLQASAAAESGVRAQAHWFTEAMHKANEAYPGQPIVLRGVAGELMLQPSDLHWVLDEPVTSK